MNIKVVLILSLSYFYGCNNNSSEGIMNATSKVFPKISDSTHFEYTGDSLTLFGKRFDEFVVKDSSFVLKAFWGYLSDTLVLIKFMGGGKLAIFPMYIVGDTSIHVFHGRTISKDSIPLIATLIPYTSVAQITTDSVVSIQLITYEGHSMSYYHKAQKARLFVDRHGPLSYKTQKKDTVTQEERLLPWMWLVPTK